VTAWRGDRRRIEQPAAEQRCGSRSARSCPRPRGSVASKAARFLSAFHLAYVVGNVGSRFPPRPRRIDPGARRVARARVRRRGARAWARNTTVAASASRARSQRRQRGDSFPRAAHQAPASRNRGRVGKVGASGYVVGAALHRTPIWELFCHGTLLELAGGRAHRRPRIPAVAVLHLSTQKNFFGTRRGLIDGDGSSQR